MKYSFFLTWSERRMWKELRPFDFILSTAVEGCSYAEVRTALT